MDRYGKESEIVKVCKIFLICPGLKEQVHKKSISFMNNCGTMYSHWKQWESWEMSEEMWR